MCFRTVLAVAATICTLTRVLHAYNQTTQIKDIVCVLVLAGLKKDDLDDATLNKLTKHNVNVDQLNSEYCGKNCLNEKQLSDAQSVLETTKDQSEHYSTTDMNSISRQTLNKTKLIIETTSQPYHTTNSSTLNFTNYLWSFFNNTSKKGATNATNNKPKTKSINEHDDIVKVTDIENIWNMITNINNNTTEITTTNNPQIEQHMALPKLTEVEMIKLLSEQYWSNKQPNEHVEKNNIRNDSFNPRINPITTIPEIHNLDTNKHTKTSKTVISSDKVENITTEVLSLQNKEVIAILNKILENFNHKNMNSRKSGNKIDIVSQNKTDSLNKLEKITNKSEVNTENINIHTIGKENNVKESAISLPANVIQDLANRVKYIIMKDFQNKSIFEDVKTETPKTTESGQKVDDNLLREFLQLFRDFKKEKLLYERNYEIIHKRQLLAEESKPNMNTTISINETTNYPAYTAFGAKTSRRLVPKYKPLGNLAKIPLTIQTNLFEIPPLFETNFNPQNIINIIVSTTPKFKNTNINLSRHIPAAKIQRTYTYANHKANYKSGAVKTNNNIRYRNNAMNKQRKANTRIEETVYRDTEMDKINKLFNTYHRKTQPNAIHYTTVRNNYYKRTESDYSLYTEPDEINFKNSFGDSKEHVTNLMASLDKEIDRYSKTKVGRRKLMPLRTKYKHSYYDDTHFKEFLKTQQKVNDVLEKILAMKSPRRHLPSVEAI